jgi:hypothetical protein
METSSAQDHTLMLKEVDRGMKPNVVDIRRYPNLAGDSFGEVDDPAQLTAENAAVVRDAFVADRLGTPPLPDGMNQHQWYLKGQSMLYGISQL